METKGKCRSIWKEAVVAYFKVLSEHPSGNINENHEKPPSPLRTKEFVLFHPLLRTLCDTTGVDNCVK
jgi:hypothetical protein